MRWDRWEQLTGRRRSQTKNFDDQPWIDIFLDQNRHTACITSLVEQSQFYRYRCFIRITCLRNGRLVWQVTCLHRIMVTKESFYRKPNILRYLQISLKSLSSRLPTKASSLELVLCTEDFLGSVEEKVRRKMSGSDSNPIKTQDSVIDNRNPIVSSGLLPAKHGQAPMIYCCPNVQKN